MSPDIKSPELGYKYKGFSEKKEGKGNFLAKNGKNAGGWKEKKVRAIHVFPSPR